MSTIVSALLVLAATAIGLVSFVGIIRPLPRLWLPTRKRAAQAFGGAFVLLIIGGMLAPKPTPEELEGQKVEEQQQAEVASTRPAPPSRKAEEQQKTEVASTPAKSASANPAVVSADTWTDGDWPLTIDRGVLTCTEFRRGSYQLKAVFITDQDGGMWPLNGTAKSHHARFGAKPAVEPIWRVDQKLMDAFPNSEATFRIDIGPLIKRGLSLCD